MKKNILVIISLIMVLALTLTGCGQKGNQDASAKKADTEVVAPSDNTQSSENTTTEEPFTSETPATNDGDSVGFHGAGYTYRICGEDFYIETDLSQYISADNVFSSNRLLVDLGIMNTVVYDDNYRLQTPTISNDNIAKLEFWITDRGGNGSGRRYVIKYDSNASPSCEYASIDHPNNRNLTYEQIVLFTYGCENIKKDLSTSPLGSHLQNLYYETGDLSELRYNLP